MKTLSRLAMVGVLLMSGKAWGWSGSLIDDGRVVVKFVDPEKFTDVKDRYLESDKGVASILDELRDELMTRGRNYIPSGERLEIYFTDIDLAGEFEPWLGPQFDDIRIVKDIYPPRASLYYKLFGPDGTVLKEGKRDLSDLAFQYTTISINVNDHLRYDKELLGNWLRTEFPRQKKA